MSADEAFVKKELPASPVPGQSLDRRAFVQLATTFGLSLSVPGLAAKAPAAPLTADDMTFIGEVSELIIPTTDTGGALAAGVPDFVKLMLSDWFSASAREKTWLASTINRATSPIAARTALMRATSSASVGAPTFTLTPRKPCSIAAAQLRWRVWRS